MKGHPVLKSYINGLFWTLDFLGEYFINLEENLKDYLNEYLQEYFINLEVKIYQ